MMMWHVESAFLDDVASWLYN